MSLYPIDVLGTGAVLLGDAFVCDGFHKARIARVQTHIHTDHMRDFETSKGLQDLFMSEETQQLLIAEFDADLTMRGNLYALPPGKRYAVNGCSVALFPNLHMLGSVQVLVECEHGSLGYSGD